MTAPDKLRVCVLVATKNEQENIGPCLEAVSPAEEVFVVDSQSTDNTCHIAETYGAQVVQFQYAGGYPRKRQWALQTLHIAAPWVLLLDADERVPPELWQEIADVVSNEHAADAYLIKKWFHFLGRRFRFGGFSHDAVLLFRKGCAHFEDLDFDDSSSLDMEVHERLVVSGKTGRLRTPLIHQDRKGLQAYIERHNRYSTWEAELRHRFFQTGKWGKDAIRARLFGNSQERRRFLKGIAVRVPFEPWLWFCYHYFFRLGFLEGKPGLIASRVRAHYICQVRAKLYELRLMAKRADT